MNTTLFDTSVLPLFEQRRAAYLAEARFVALKIARNKGSVTVDDVRSECPPPGEIDPRVMGAILRGLERSGELIAIGYEGGTRKMSHNRPIMRYRLPS